MQQQTKRKPGAKMPLAKSGLHLRQLAVLLVMTLGVSLVGLGGPAVILDSAALISKAQATPAPGQPGGNHSKPGDNKKKKKNTGQRNNNGPGDRSDTSRRQSDQSSTEHQRPESRVGNTRVGGTDQNNRLTPDDNDRSTGIRTGNDGAARQTPPDQQPANPDPASQAGQIAETQDGIPAKRPLTASEQETYDYFRGSNAVRRLPSGAATRDIQDRFVNDQVPYNDHPFGQDFNAGKPTVDHLVPVRRVVQMPGFNDLDRATQESIIDSQENLVLTPLRENTSRRDLTYAEWPGRQTGPPLDPAYEAARIAQEGDVYRQLQERVDTAFAQQFPGRPLPSSAGPLEIDRTAPPLDIQIDSPIESLPLQTGPELPLNSPIEVPTLPGTVEIPANPVPAVPNYPLPPAAPPAPPIANPAPPAIGNPLPAVIPNPTPPPVGVPQTPISTPVPPAVVNPMPVSPWQVLFPGAVPATTPAVPIPGNILTSLPPAAAPPVAAPAEPSIRIPVGEIIKRLPAELLQAPGLLIPIPAPIGLCSYGGGCGPRPMAMPTLLLWMLR